jgi:hypothetical protein
MLRIRKEQMQALARRTRQRFVGMMEAYLLEHFTAWVEKLPEAELRGWLERALAKAEQYGVTTEPEAAQLVLLLMVLGVDADVRLPWVAETLSSRGLAPVGKVKKLAAVAREHGTPGLEHVLVTPEMED